MPTNPNDTWGPYIGYSMGTTVPYTITTNTTGSNYNNATTYTYSGNANNYRYETNNEYVTISFDTATNTSAVCTFVDNIPNIKCIGAECLNDVIIPKFDHPVNRHISMGIGVFAEKTFCKDFVWAEYKTALVEFADNFISKLIKDNLLVYSHEDNEYTMKKD